MTHHSTIATTYARSLLELANESGETEAVANDMDGLRQVLEENPTFVAFLKDPGISEDERQATLDKVFAGQVNGLVRRFLGLLNTRGRLGDLAPIAGAFEALLDEQLGKIEVDVTVAQRLGDAELEDVRRQVGAALKKDPVVHQYVDPEIIGGLVLRVGDQIIDASVRRQLQAMRQKLLRG